MGGKQKGTNNLFSIQDREHLQKNQSFVLSPTREIDFAGEWLV
jgi:prolyl-tRNA synthetase